VVLFYIRIAKLFERPSIRHMTRFRAGMCLLGFKKTKFSMLDHISPKKNFSRIFDGKFRDKKDFLTMKMLPSKLPLVVVVAQ